VKFIYTQDSLNYQGKIYQQFIIDYREEGDGAKEQAAWWDNIWPLIEEKLKAKRNNVSNQLFEAFKVTLLSIVHFVSVLFFANLFSHIVPSFSFLPIATAYSTVANKSVTLTLVKAMMQHESPRCP
jgi:hypothetical protein